MHWHGRFTLSIDTSSTLVRRKLLEQILFEQSHDVQTLLHSHTLVSAHHRVSALLHASFSLHSHILRPLSPLSPLEHWPVVVETKRGLCVRIGFGTELARAVDQRCALRFHREPIEHFAQREDQVELSQESLVLFRYRNVRSGLFYLNNLHLFAAHHFVLDDDRQNKANPSVQVLLVPQQQFALGTLVVQRHGTEQFVQQLLIVRLQRAESIERQKRNGLIGSAKRGD